MKVVVLGAAGKLGQRLVASCLAGGHEVTAAVREPEAFRQRWGEQTPERLRTVAFDAMDGATLDAALAGQEAIVSTAGNVADGQRFVDLFDSVVSAAERNVGAEGRTWMLAGAAVLEIPHLRRIGAGLPFVPALYWPHVENWRRLQRSALDWALMCPGPMVVGDDQPVKEGLCESADVLPYAVGSWVRYAPPVALSVMLKRNLERLTVPYRGVADVIADNLRSGGRFARCRVGIGRRPAPSDALLARRRS